LWEVRARMVTRLNFNAGTTRVLQVVTNGMKVAPNNPTFIQARDAIMAAAGTLAFAPEAHWMSRTFARDSDCAGWDSVLPYRHPVRLL
jgi:hypothetical protein